MTRLHQSLFDFTHPAGSIWEALNGAEAEPPRRLEGNDRCDILVVGGGLTGLSAACRLAAAHGRKVILLEAGSLGWGGSSRGLGWCGPSPANVYARAYGPGRADQRNALIRAELQGMEIARSVLAEAGEPAAAGTPLLTAARDQKQLDRLRSLIESVSGLGGPSWRMARQEEMAAGGAASAGFSGGFLSEDGFGADPLHLTRLLAARARKLGVRVYANVRVRLLEEQKGGVEADCGGGTVSAKQAILAVNGYSRGRAIPAMAGRLFHTAYCAIATRPLLDAERLANGLTKPVVLRGDDPGQGEFVLRLLPDGRAAYSAAIGPDTDPAHAAQARQQIRARFLKLLPGLRDVQISQVWRGVGCRTGAGLPAAAPLTKQGRLFFAGGLDFDSVNLALSVGQACADLAGGLTDQPFAASAPLEPIRFPALKQAWMDFQARRNAV